MATRIVIDPVTRIEGHLRLEAEVDEAGAITAAYASGTMVRGIERILVGRDPRVAWAFAQRACGVCTLVHAIASVRAVEDALGIRIPPAANLVRNLMIAQQYAHDHVMHFYHLHAFDWLDVAAALTADPAEAARLQQQISPRPAADAAYFGAVQRQVQGIYESDLQSIFGHGWWGHPAYALPPAMDLLLLAHYFEALDWQAGATAIHVVFGGKNPHPNLVVGGVPLPLEPDSPGAVSPAQLARVRASIDDIIRFVDEVYLPDVLALAGYYPDDFGRGEGLGRFLTWGEFPAGDITDLATLQVPRAVIQDRDLTRLVTPLPADLTEVQEFVAHSWYRQSAGDDAGLHPWQGQTDLHYSGPTPPYEQLEVAGKYSWLKAPRWRGQAMEVGPLARVLVLYATGDEATRAGVDEALARLGLPFSALYSTMGRTLARAVETSIFAGWLRTWFTDLEAAMASGATATFDDSRWEPATWPAQARGFGFMEAPRGALGHWVVIDHDRVANYQLVVPTTWNASPRDAAGQPGAYEAALLGTRLARSDQPLEVLRIVHSFDPCMACAVHLVTPNGAGGV